MRGRSTKQISLLICIFLAGLSVFIFSGSIQVSAPVSQNGTPSTYSLTPAETQLLAGAADRIERYRKGNATVKVTDAGGNPIRNAAVHVEMLNHDFLFGSCLLLDDYEIATQNKAYADAFASIFNYATVSFYWGAYESKKGVVDRDKVNRMVSWARDHNMKVKGHPLVWDLSIPSWVPQSPDAFWDAQLLRIKRETQDFCGRVDSWTLVDEPVPDQAKDNILRRFMKDNGPASVTKQALDAARQTCSDAKLIVNDYQTKNNYHGLLEEVIRLGGKVDGIGLQSHMHMSIWKLDYVWNTCELFKDFNIPLHFTEVTVLSGNLKTDQDWLSYHPDWNTTAEGERSQADYVPLLYTILFSNPSVESITWWDLTDSGAWQGAPAGLIRKDMSPKPAYDVLMKLIHGDWWTDLTISTDDNGIASWRGFYGQYRLSVAAPNNIVQKNVVLSKDKDNSFSLQLPGEHSLLYLWIIAGVVLIIVVTIALWFQRKRASSFGK